MVEVAPREALATILVAARAYKGVTDLSLAPEEGAVVTVAERLRKLPNVDMIQVRAALEDLGRHLTEEETERFEMDGSVTIRLFGEGYGLVRAHLFHELGSPVAECRFLDETPPAFSTLGFPTRVGSVVERRQGLFFVTGPIESGKSTLVASLVRRINEELGDRKIMILASPQEYHHKPAKAIVRHLTVGPRGDVPTYLEGIHSALRANVRVIVVSEMFATTIADDDTVAAAIEAANSGTLVLATMHAPTVAVALEQIVGSFSAERTARMRYLLSQHFLGAICSRLVPKAKEVGLIPACEMVWNTSAITALIERNDLRRMRDLLRTGGNEGMQTLEQDLLRLMRAGTISEDDARRYAVFPNEVG